VRPSQRLSVALACVDGEWPHDDWPDPDDRFVGRVVHLAQPYRVPDEDVDVVVLRCDEPSRALRDLGATSVPVVVVSPRQDVGTIIEVFRGGAGYLIQGDYCTCMLSSAVLGATVGRTYLSPSACDALREALQQPPTGGQAMERLRNLLSPREQQIMELLSTGLGAQEIGLRLRLSEKTVRNNLSNIYAKLDARGGTDAVLLWLGAAPVPRT
jgi:DNA-binding NarL/FixJ family response regulator